jgi:hypothetical protein
MFPFLKKAREQFSKRTETSRKPRRTRLVLEALEERITPSIYINPQLGSESITDAFTALSSDKVGASDAVVTGALALIGEVLSPVIGGIGGPGASFAVDALADQLHDEVKAPNVQLIFWGNFNQPGLPTPYAFFDAAQNLLDSPFLQGTAQYDTSGGATLINTPVFDSDPLPSQLDQGSLTGEVDKAMNGNTNVHTIYVVVTPPQSNGNPWPNNFGKNTAGFNTFNLNITDPYPVIWAGNTGPNNPTTSPIDNFTWDLSHELVEMMTNPKTWVVPPSNNPAVSNMDPNPVDQTADYEANYYYGFRTATGAEAQPYWSAQDQMFIVPDGFSQRQITVTPHWSGGQFQGAYDLSIQGDSVQGDSVVLGTENVNSNGNSYQDLYVTVNGETAKFDIGTIANINIQLTGSDNAVTLDGLPSGVTVKIFGTDKTLNAIDGNLHINYAMPDTVQGSVIVEHVRQNLYINDNSGAYGTMTVTDTSVTVDNNAPLTYSAAQALYVSSGSTIAVQSAPSFPLYVSTAGTVILGGTNSLADLGSNIEVDSAGQLIIDGSADSSTNGFTVSPNSVSFGSNYVNYFSVGSLTINGGSGGNLFQVNGTSAPLTLDTGAGNYINTVDIAADSNPVTIVGQATQEDKVIIGSNHTLTTIPGPVTLSQGTIDLTIDDQSDPNAHDVNISGSGVVFNTVEMFFTPIRIFGLFALGGPMWVEEPMATINFAAGTHLSQLKIDSPSVGGSDYYGSNFTPPWDSNFQVYVQSQAPSRNPDTTSGPDAGRIIILAPYHIPPGGLQQIPGATSFYQTLAVESFETTMYTMLDLILSVFGQPHAELDAALAQLHAAMTRNPASSTFEGQMAMLVGESIALNELNPQPLPPG